MGHDYRVIADPEYGYLRVDPVPSQEEVEKYYEQDFYSSEYKQFNDSSLEVQQEEKDFFDSRWEGMCRHFEEHFGGVEGVSVFDVGFGFAQALLYFKNRGMLAAGLEPSPEGVEYALGQGIEAYGGGIEQFDVVGDRRFDVVTILNVLEHLRTPADTLRRVREELLAPGGLLALEIPNEFNAFQLAANAEHGLGEWWLCPPNHINYFSATSLCTLLETCGYRILSKEASFPLEMFLLMGDVYVGNAELGRTCHEKRVRFEATLRRQGQSEALDRFYAALAELDLGRQVTIYATAVQSA
jgi:2-polyprenyl-3-methyl-5-hydroxy-6-metoxy-1,4-benzoquinol methylase